MRYVVGLVGAVMVLAALGVGGVLAAVGAEGDTRAPPDEQWTGEQWTGQQLAPAGAGGRAGRGCLVGDARLAGMACLAGSAHAGAPPLGRGLGP